MATLCPRGLEKQIFFHSTAASFDPSLLRQGSYISYRIDEAGSKPRAVELRIEQAPSKAHSSGKHRTTAFTPDYTGDRYEFDSDQIQRFLEEIKSWRLEAKLDDVKKYFFHIPHLGDVVSGRSCYVVGRKGTGKTAIVQYISENRSSRQFVTKLSFKNFPFNELYKQDNNQFTRPNQYITLWKLIIYSFVCRMMTHDETLDPLLRERIKKAFPQVDSDSLSALIGRWAAGDVGISIFGTGFNIGNWFQKKNAFSIADKVENLEAFLAKNVGNSSYYVLFDELDEDYKNVYETYKGSEYIDLLTSLFKAVQDVKSRFSTSSRGVLPVVFLRDDIYDLLQDADKNKWKDFEFDLDWSRDDIKRMLAYRLSKVIGKQDSQFEQIWYSLFSSESVSFSNGRKSNDSFTYISSDPCLT